MKKQINITNDLYFKKRLLSLPNEIIYIILYNLEIELLYNILNTKYISSFLGLNEFRKIIINKLFYILVILQKNNGKIYFHNIEGFHKLNIDICKKKNIYKTDGPYVGDRYYNEDSYVNIYIHKDENKKSRIKINLRKIENTNDNRDGENYIILSFKEINESIIKKCIKIDLNEEYEKYCYFNKIKKDLEYIISILKIITHELLIKDTSKISISDLGCEISEYTYDEDSYNSCRY